jgi:hypothetical protein
LLLNRDGDASENDREWDTALLFPPNEPWRPEFCGWIEVPEGRLWPELLPEPIESDCTDRNKSSSKVWKKKLILLLVRITYNK